MIVRVHHLTLPARSAILPLSFVLWEVDTDMEFLRTEEEISANSEEPKEREDTEFSDLFYDLLAEMRY